MAASVVLADNTDRVMAIDADTADVLWERDFDGRFVSTVSVDPAGSRVFVTLSDDYPASAAMLDLHDGSTIWRSPMPSWPGSSLVARTRTRRTGRGTDPDRSR